jgi:hypothetical protein
MLKQVSFMLSSFFHLSLCSCSCLCLYFSFSSRLIVLVEEARVEEAGSKEEAGSEEAVSLSEKIGRLLGSLSRQLLNATVDGR